MRVAFDFYVNYYFCISLSYTLTFKALMRTMIVIDFKKLSSLDSISFSFGVPIRFIESVIDNPEEYYQELRIPKKGRNRSKYRIVFKAQEKLAHLQSEIKSHIEHNIYNKDKTIKEEYVTKYANGFIRGKGIVQNARNHLDKKYLLNVDIRNFFKSITIKDVYHVLIKLGTPHDGAEIISELITYNGKLEEGLHCSPLISNLHCYNLDHELYRIASAHGCSYSRYADDISFSSNTRTPKLNLIEQVFKKHHFQMNQIKTRFSKRGQPQYVTGLSVTDSKYPRIPKPMKRQLRQELHYMKKYGYRSHFEKIGIDSGSILEEMLRITGRIRYISAIEPVLGKKFKELFRKISKNE